MKRIHTTLLLLVLSSCGSSVTPSDGTVDPTDVHAFVDGNITDASMDASGDVVPLRRESIARVLTGIGGFTYGFIDLMPRTRRPGDLDVDIDGCRVRLLGTQGTVYGGAASFESHGTVHRLEFIEEYMSYEARNILGVLPPGTLVTMRVEGSSDHPGFEVSERVPPPFRGILLPRPGTVRPFRSDRPFTIQWDGAPGDDFARIWVLGSDSAAPPRRDLAAICLVPFSLGTYMISSNVLRMFDGYPFSRAIGIGRARVVRLVLGDAPVLFYVERSPSESSLQFQ
jgi:hypothetical protein